MFKNFKKDLILSSLVTLLPALAGILLWDRLPELMPTHWGFDGAPDSYGSKALTVFALPLTFLAAQWLCLFFTGKDPKNQGRNQKPIRMVIWIMPVISLFVSALFYFVALGNTVNIPMLTCTPLGFMFIVIGNYMPKCQQNHTIGIKISWTLANEENWNLTHRFAGKCWVGGGLLMLLCIFLPVRYSVIVIFAGIFLLAFAPMIYSCRIYLRHKKQGIVYPKVNPFGSKKAGIFASVPPIVILFFVGVLMFTGDLNYVLSDTGFTVEASYYGDLTVAYNSIDFMEFREGNVPGIRIGGLGTARLLLGNFQNEEFGSYTRYTYTNPDGCIVLRSGSKTLVLSAKRYSETLKLYMQLLEKIPQS